ncbi:MAG: helix-turn-helix domain-containing protein [Clostridia bacterium]|nr:helix-turn-helix domain-containing protein [Clostridia bacterium]
MKYSNDYTDSNIISSFGKEIKEYRVRLNLTQSDLASECGISSSTLERIENGSDTKFSNIIKIMRAFNLIDNLGFMIPDVEDDFKAYYENKPKRKRASKPKAVQKPDWVWGEDRKKG